MQIRQNVLGIAVPVHIIWILLVEKGKVNNLLFLEYHRAHI